MILGIDASNIRTGGGVRHLVAVLKAAQPQEHGFRQVVVWGGESTLGQIEARRWLVKAHQRLLDKPLPYRAYWQRFRLARLARAAQCAVLFVPGGSYAGNFRPVVTLSQNLLPFDWGELRRYGWSWVALRLLLLRLTQVRTFRRADGVIFLTRYAREVVMRVVGEMRGCATIIPHGVDKEFSSPPREHRPLSQYSAQDPLRLLYVSIVDMYKHQWKVAEAVAMLRRDGIPLALDMVGPAYPPALERLRTVMRTLDPAGQFLHYRSAVPHAGLPALYTQADICIFASSCENMPNILLEGMAAALPIACSNRGPMPEVLADAGLYFDPEDVTGIAAVLRRLLDSPPQRARFSAMAMERAQGFSWDRCADHTLAFLAANAPRQVLHSEQLTRAPGLSSSRR